jgi:hypothetical protein
LCASSNLQQNKSRQQYDVETHIDASLINIDASLIMMIQRNWRSVPFFKGPTQSMDIEDRVGATEAQSDPSAGQADARSSYDIDGGRAAAYPAGAYPMRSESKARCSFPKRFAGLSEIIRVRVV